MTKFFRQSSYKHAWTSIDKQATNKADHVCIDMNQILHSGAIKMAAQNPTHFMALLFRSLDEILNGISPTKSLVLAFDGPAPFTKMQTQRSRRRKLLSHSLFTPGTDFMNAMENLMILYTLQRAQRPGFKDVTVFISGAQVAGEGEIKIVEWINSHMPNHNDSVIVCGSDSDIVLQVMCLPHVPNIRVLQSGDGYSKALCNVTDLLDELLRTVSALGDLTPEDMPDPASFRFDIVVLFVMQGNDYLPKLRCATIRKALAAYGRALKRLPPEHRGFMDRSSWSSSTTDGAEGHRERGPNANGFNFAALWCFLDELHRAEDQLIALPVPMPNVVSTLNQLYQSDLNKIKRDAGGGRSAGVVGRTGRYRKDGKGAAPAVDRAGAVSEGRAVEGAAEGAWPPALDIENPLPLPQYYDFFRYEDEDEDEEGEGEGEGEGDGAEPLPQVGAMIDLLDADATNLTHRRTLWGSSVLIRGRNFTTPLTYMTKRAARMAVADDALRAIDPAAHAAVMAGQRGAVSKLKRLREAVWAEQKARGGFGGGADGAESETETETESGSEIAEKLKETVTSAEYSQFVRESDCEAYMSGILWVAQMYVDGVCPDASFSFQGLPAPSAFGLRMLVERAWRRAGGAAEEVTLEALLDPVTGVTGNSPAAQQLRSRINVPCDPRVRPLSAAAACVCVVPEDAVEYVPERLRGVWKAMQQGFFRRFDSDADADTDADGGGVESGGGGGGGGGVGEGEGEGEGDGGGGGGCLQGTTYAELTKMLAEVWDQNGHQLTAAASGPATATGALAKKEIQAADPVTAIEVERGLVGQGEEGGSGSLDDRTGDMDSDSALEQQHKRSSRRSRKWDLGSRLLPPAQWSAEYGVRIGGGDVVDRGRAVGREQRRQKGKEEGLRKMRDVFRAVSTGGGVRIGVGAEGVTESNSDSSKPAATETTTTTVTTATTTTTETTTTATTGIATTAGTTTVEAAETAGPPVKRWRRSVSVTPIDGYIFGANPFAGASTAVGPGAIGSFSSDAKAEGGNGNSGSVEATYGSEYERAVSVKTGVSTSRSGSGSGSRAATGRVSVLEDPLFAPQSDPAWVVIAPSTNISSLGFQQKCFSTFSIAFPLQLPFRAPHRLPEGHRIFTAAQRPVSERLRRFGLAELRYFSDSGRGGNRIQESTEDSENASRTVGRRRRKSTPTGTGYPSVAYEAVREPAD